MIKIIRARIKRIRLRRLMPCMYLTNEDFGRAGSGLRR